MFRTPSQLFSLVRSSGQFWLILAFAVSFIAIAPILFMGVPEGFDLEEHLRFAGTFHDSILSGTLIPGWAASDNFGLGSVGIRFYPPVADYLLGATQILTGDWYTSFLANSFFWMFPGCFGTYFWAQEYLSSRDAAFAASLYAIMPYHLLQIYQFLMYSEFAAAGILPFCFLFVTRIVRRARTSDSLWLAVSVSLLILTHIPTTIFGLLILAVYTLFLIDSKHPGKTLKGIAISGLLTIGATSFYWLRVISELGYVQHSASQNLSGDSIYRNYLFPILYSSGDKMYWERALWMFDVTAALTFFFIISSVFALVFEWRKNDPDNSYWKLLFAVSATGVFLIFMLSVPSSYVWDSLRILQTIQFPTRLLSAASLIGAICFAVFIRIRIARDGRLSRAVGYSALILIGAVLIFDLSESVIPSAPLSRASFHEKYGDLANQKGCDCWWPTWARNEAFANTNMVDAGGRSVSISQWQRESREFLVEAGEAGTVRVATFYYPYWRAEANGVLTSVIPDDYGVILVPIAGAKTNVRLYFQEPGFLEIGKIVSLTTWVAIFTAILIFAFKTPRLETSLAVI